MSSSDTSERFERAARAFDEVHRSDPRPDPADADAPWSLRYHRRLAHWVEVLAPDRLEGAGEALRLAARCQHLRRWALPRSDFPEGRSGYKRWRSQLARMHADEAESVLRGVGYGDDTIASVRRLLLKKGLESDPQVQLFEDAICLVFLENELESFAVKHADDKLIDILQKTWRKMSSRGRRAARELASSLDEDLQRLIERALEG